MLIKKDEHLQDEDEMQMTPMIDIVFQLLIFFLLSAKFIALEGTLSSYLPKDKGLDQTVVPVVPVNVPLILTWTKEADQEKVLCETLDYRYEDGTREPVHEFPAADPIVPGSTTFHYGPPGDPHRVEIDYVIPDFDVIERYLDRRKRSYEDPKGTGLPVTVEFDDEVPVQMVTTLLDICTRLGITDFTITAREME